MHRTRLVDSARFAALAVMATGLVSAQFYTETKLVSDIAGAHTTDTHLVNPWGLSVAPGGPWWVSDEGSGVSTLYDGSGNIVPLVVTIPPASGSGKGTPTGTVFHPGLGAFLFVTLDGTISSWTGGASATIKVTNPAASYTGVTIATRGAATLIYAANQKGAIDVYDQTFHAVNLGAGAFVDPNLPVGLTPYNVQSIGATIYVTYSGPGNGVVDAYDVNGVLKLRFSSGPFLSAPWGVALAPAAFGKFSGRLLVGNVGSGKIGAFDPATGFFKGFVLKAVNKPIVATGLWALAFGNGGAAGPTTTLFFTAGIKGYAHGLFGSITAN